MDGSNETSGMTGRGHKLLWDNRVLMIISLLLAIVIWVSFAVLDGQEIKVKFKDIPVAAEFTNTIAEQREWEAFLPNTDKKLQDLTVEVEVLCKRHVTVTPEDLRAEFQINTIATTGQQEITISVKPTKNNANFSIRSVSPARISAFIDHPETREFELSAYAVGEIEVEEGYQAQEPMLSQKTVQVRGPRQNMRQIRTVRAELPVEGVLAATTTYETIPVYPVNEYGDKLLYLTVEEGRPEVSAQIPVWKEVRLKPDLSYETLPMVYQKNSLKASIRPGVIRVAMPEEEIPEDGRLPVPVQLQDVTPGTVPEKTQLMISTKVLQENLRVLDGTKDFTVEMDLTGFTTVRRKLSGTAIAFKTKGSPNEAVVFSDLWVTIVCPEGVAEEVKSEPLTGLAERPESREGGSYPVPVKIEMAREDAWIYGEYVTRARF